MDEMLTQLSCADFAEALASAAPVPGGGGAAALVGALGVALSSMVGNFTTGKKRYADVEDDVRDMIARGTALRQRLLELVEEDALAFEPLSRAYAIPKDAPARDHVLEKAALTACSAPMEMAGQCAQAIVLLEEMREKGSKMLLSDVGCGALMCAAAMECAAMNVFINTASMKNRIAAKELEMQITWLMDEYLPRARTVAAQVTAQIRKENM